MIMKKVALFLFCAFLCITAAAAQFEYSGSLRLGFDEEHISSLKLNNLACGDVALGGYFATHFGAVNLAAHSNACGRCITFECLKPEDCRDSPMTNVTVRVIDSCTFCDNTTLVSNSYSVRELVGRRVEAVDVLWSFVDCSSREPTTSGVSVAAESNVDAVVKTGNEIISVAQQPTPEPVSEESMFLVETSSVSVDPPASEVAADAVPFPLQIEAQSDESTARADGTAAEVSLSVLSPVPELNLNRNDAVMISGARLITAPGVEISGVRQPAPAGVEISGVRGRR